MPLSRLFRLISIVIIGGMLVLAVFALTFAPPTPQEAAATQQEQTIQAQMIAIQTQLVGTPDAAATARARLTATAAPTPSISERAEDAAEDAASGTLGFLGGIWGFLRGLWNLFSFGGLPLQCLCCLIIPLGGLFLLARESAVGPR